jgi:hypothetical protein
MSGRGRTISKLVSVLVAGGLLVAVAMLVLSTTAPPVKAWGNLRCDFLTGGGWIVINGAKGTFGVGGGCKNGSPTWGHLEYHDHGYNGTVTNGQGLNVHGTSITGYFPVGTDGGTDQHPTGERLICGTATTNLLPPNDNVNFVVDAKDAGEPGVNDHFDIRLRNQLGTDIYDTTTECWPHYLGSSAPCAAGNGGGGNIQLHDDNPSTTGDFGGSCPAY